MPESATGYSPLRLSSPSGLRLEANSNGSVRRFDCEAVSLGLFVGNEVEGGPANLYLRRRANPIEWTTLLGPSSPTRFHLDASGRLTGTGTWHGISYSLALVLARGLAVLGLGLVLQLLHRLGGVELGAGRLRQRQQQPCGQGQRGSTSLKGGTAQAADPGGKGRRECTGAHRVGQASPRVPRLSSGAFFRRFALSRAALQLDRLIDIMARLRAPDGCPWDREQELKTLRPYLIEEAYEVLDAMDAAVDHGEHKPGALRELPTELGDLLFQIVFHAQLARERGEFEMADVIQAISDKLESRHPHVFGADKKKYETPDAFLNAWAGFKEKERKAAGVKDPSVIDGVPSAAPALWRAERTTEKASRVGFDWKDWKGPRAKIDEELAELDQAIATGDRERIEDELGDVLFSLCNLARFTKTPAEDALRKTVRKFERRFRYVEAALKAQGKKPGDVGLEELDALWDQAKAMGG